MKNWGGHFTPELGGHFELESGGHFKLELGGQYHWNLQSYPYKPKNHVARILSCGHNKNNFQKIKNPTKNPFLVQYSVSI